MCADELCSICSDFIAVCTKCVDNADVIGGTCDCNLGYNWNIATEECEFFCPSPCDGCTRFAFGGCLACDTGYYEHSGVCETYCPTGYS